MTTPSTTAGAASTAQADSKHYDDVVVKFSDLNLDSEAGSKVLYARLKNAAARACGNGPATRGARPRAEYRDCVEDKLDRAVDEVGARNLYALHRRGTVDSAG